MVSVDADTGAVTALTAGGIATIRAVHIYNGWPYEITYTIYVAETNELVYRIVHYYDKGYNIRENGAAAAIQNYHNVVAAKFYSIFGVKLVGSVQSFESICDQCKTDRYGTLSSVYLNINCPHSPVCLNTLNIRNDLFNTDSDGNEITSVVIWSGHRMLNYENDRSNSVNASHSVVMTTYGIGDWSDEDAKYAKRTKTLFHELSHQLGVPDHYCYDDAEEEGGKCSNPNCDTCVKAYDDTRKCIMGQGTNITDNTVYCTECLNAIGNHLADHHRLS